MEQLPAALLAQLRLHNYHGDTLLNPLQGTPALCHAAAHCPQLVEALLDAGADPNLACEPDGRPPLMHAAWQLQEDEVQIRWSCTVFDQLLAAGAEVDTVDRSGYSALGLALMAQNSPLATRLLASGAGVERVFPPAFEETALESAAKHLPHLLPLLVRAGSAPDTVDGRGRGVFHWLARHPALAHMPATKAVRMLDWMQRHGARLDDADRDGNTPLHELEDVHVLFGQWLLRRGADCNARNRHGITPLMVAAVKSPHATRFLMTQGADPCARSKSGVDALMAASTFVSSLAEQASMTQHQVGGALRHKTAVDFLRGAAHRLPRLRPMGGSRFPQRLSCFNSVAELLAAGADPAARARDGSTALMRAARFQPESLLLLLASGAEVHARDRSGWTALMCAAGSPRAEMAVEALLGAGANPAEAFEKPEVEMAFRENPAALAVLQGALLDADAGSARGSGKLARL